MSKLLKRTASVFLAVMLIAGVGCDAVGGEDHPEAAAMRVLLTDAPFPFDLVEETAVTITSVSAATQTEGQFVLSDEDVTLNLLDLQGGVTELLAEEEELPSAVYTKILLEVSEASVVLENGEVFDLKVPGGTIQVPIDNLDLSIDETATVLLDFDVGQSFVVQGNPATPAGIKGFLFKPVVRSLGFVSDDEDLEEGAELQGTIEEVGDDFIIVADTRFFIDEETAFEDGESFAALTPGTLVEIEYVEAAEDVFVAVEVDIEDDEEEREVHETAGAVEEVGDGFIVVGGTRFAVTPGTEFEGVSGLAGLAVGTEVEVDFVEEADAEGLIAVEIEVDDDEDEDDDLV